MRCHPDQESTMPRVAKELSDAALRHIKEPGRYPVGGVPGLYLAVPDAAHPDGYKREARHWVLRVVVAGKRRDIGLGGYPEVGLGAARQKAKELREQIRQGRDPLAERRAAKQAVAAAAAAAVRFRDFAADYIMKHEKEWSNPKHSSQWTATIENYANPIIGDMIVADIQTEHILKVLEQPVGDGDAKTTLWLSRTETAKRLRGRVESILDAATVRKLRSGENPARWKGHLDHTLPAPGKVAKVEHHAAMPYAEVPVFVQRLQEVEGQGAKALLFAILTAARSGEVRGATWNEIDVDNAVWVIPAGRMKARREHRVPLSPQAVELLRQQTKGKPDDLVFPGAKKGKPLSDMSLTAVLRRLGVKVTAHGFRSSFRDWAADRTTFPRELAEKALAHALSSEVEAAYQRSDMFDKRRKLMEAWGGYATTPPAAAGTVTRLDERRRARGAA
jgi:integrase